MRFILLTFALLASSSPLFASDLFLGLTDDIDLFFILPGLAVGFVLIFYGKSQYLKPPASRLGFVSISPHQPQRFFPLSEDVESMEPVVAALAGEGTKVYSNLTKITLTHKASGTYLEEKNYKISILLNRRRCRRGYLNDGDVLDMGELTLMFVSPNQHKEREDQVPASDHLIPRVKRAQGKPIKAYPTLIPSDSRKKTFFLTKNLTFIGRSDTCDLVSKAKSISRRHSSIEKVAGRYKISDLQTIGGTFVNGRRVEQKFLKDGDHITFESVKYTFSLSGNAR